MTKRVEKLVPCSRENSRDCFANECGYCKALWDTEFTRPCPFYKTKAQYEREKPKNIKRRRKVKENLLSEGKREAIETANELGFSPDCADKIIAAKNDVEIQNILHDERLKD